MEGLVDEDRDGASEAGFEEHAAHLLKQDHVPRSSGVLWVPRRGRFANTVFPASEFDEKHSQIFGGTVQECHEGGISRSWWI